MAQNQEEKEEGAATAGIVPQETALLVATTRCKSEATSTCDWSRLPAELLAQKIGVWKDLVTLSHVCKPWHTQLKMEVLTRVEPMLVFWADDHMLLYQSDKGWSPPLESSMPPSMSPPLLIEGPLLVQWKSSKNIVCYNLHTRQSKHWKLQVACRIVKAAAVPAVEGTRILCIQSQAYTSCALRFLIQSLDTWGPDLLRPTTWLLEEEELEKSYGTAYPCAPYRCSLIDTDNMIVLKEEKCAYFLMNNMYGRYLFWYKWDSDKWGCSGKVQFTGSARDRFYIGRPLVNLKGKVGVVGWTFDPNAPMLGIHYLNLAVDSQTLAEDDKLIDIVTCSMMPHTVWARFLEFLAQVESHYWREDRDFSFEPIHITVRQCNPLFVHMFCTAKRWIAIIVYIVDRDLWDIIPLLKGGLQKYKYFALPLTPDSTLAKAAFCSKLSLRDTADAWMQKEMPLRETADAWMQKEMPNLDVRNHCSPNYSYYFEEGMYVTLPC